MNLSPIYRQDALLGHRTLFAPERAARPGGVSVPREVQELEKCPFCAGNESLTPAATLELPSEDWQVRVVPNLYPALAEKDMGASEAATNSSPSATGYHEIIIESPTHITRLTELSVAESAMVLQAYCDRLRAIEADEQVAHVVIFKNIGGEAGASLAHLHSQLMALPFVPEQVEQRLVASRHQAEKHRHSYFASEISQAERENRIVWESSDLVAFAPYASRFAHEVVILPRTPAPRFADCEESVLHQLAEGMHQIVGAYEEILSQVAYNMVLQTAPARNTQKIAFPFDDFYHWQVELFPRIAMLAGFEYGTGEFINTVLPETAAKEIREAIQASDKT